jgi:hypothetical protein
MADQQRDALDAYVLAFVEKIGSSERRRVQLYLPLDVWRGIDAVAQRTLTTVGDVVSDELRRIAHVLRCIPNDQRQNLAVWARTENERVASRGMGAGIRVTGDEKFRECRKIWVALPPRTWKVFVWYARAWEQSLDRTLSRFLSAGLRVDDARAAVSRGMDWDIPEQSPGAEDIFGNDAGFGEEGW